MRYFRSEGWKRLSESLKHAFSSGSTTESFTPGEIALLEKVANIITARRMAAPTIIFLESVEPLNFIGSQLLYALRPILELVGNPLELKKIARILERREALKVLIKLIEEKERGKE
jgi:hypothetical protein